MFCVTHVNKYHIEEPSVDTKVLVSVSVVSMYHPSLVFRVFLKYDHLCEYDSY